MMVNLPTRDQLQDDPFGFRDKDRDYQSPRGGQSFDSSYDAKVNNLARGREPMRVDSASSFDPSSDAKTNNQARPFVDTEGAVMAANQAAAAGDVSRLPRERVTPGAVGADFANDYAESKSLAANPARRMGMTGDAAMLVSAADTQNRASVRAPLPLSVSTKDIGAGPLAAPSPMAQQPSALQGGPDEKAAGQATPSPNAWKGNYAAADANGQGIYKDPKTGAISIRLTGEDGQRFMASQVPTARPGGGWISSEQSGATQAAPQKNPAPFGGNYLLIQQDIDNRRALNAKRESVAATERADKSLLYAPGSRDYISPYLSDEQARARQAEIYEQRAKDQLDAAMGAQTSRATRALADPTTSAADRKTAREWLAMMDQADESRGKTKTANEQFLRGDDTTRRGQDMSMANNAAERDNRTRVEAWKQEMDARENEANRQAQLRAAEIQAGARAKDTPQEKARSAAIEAYFKAVGDPMNQKSPDELLAMYGLRKEDISMPVDRASVIQGAKGAPGTRK